MISIECVPTEPDGCYLSTTLNLYPGGCKALLETINTLYATESPDAVAAGTPGHYCTFPDYDALARFHRAGHRRADPAVWLQSVLVTTLATVRYLRFPPQNKMLFVQKSRKICLVSEN